MSHVVQEPFIVLNITVTECVKNIVATRRGAHLLVCHIMGIMYAGLTLAVPKNKLLIAKAIIAVKVGNLSYANNLHFAETTVAATIGLDSNI